MRGEDNPQMEEVLLKHTEARFARDLIGPQVPCYLSYLVPFQAAAKRPQQLGLTPIPVSTLKGKRHYYTLLVLQKQDPGTTQGSGLASCEEGRWRLGLCFWDGFFWLWFG